jgi:hypothetical protein
MLPSRGKDGTPLLWDTLKIDAQGADEIVIEGAGGLLTHFACVIAELDLRSYNAGHRFDYATFMVERLNFIRVGRNTFVNPKFKSQFLEGRVLCFAPDVHPERNEVLAALQQSTSHR